MATTKGLTMAITKFSGEHRWLSNFYPATVYAKLGNGGWFEFESIEHAYQAQKTGEANWPKFVGITAGQAKRLGRQLKMLDNWDGIKEDVMLALLRQKFKRTNTLGQKLIETGELVIIEGNTWGDTYWGVCNGEGKNRLGHLIMQVRGEMR